MKRRGPHRPLKRRSNRLHQSRLEQLEARTLLTADLWQALDTIPESENGSATNFQAHSFEALALDVEALRTYLSAAAHEFSELQGLPVELPQPDGTYESFMVYKTDLLHPDLAAQFDDIQTYVGYATDGDGSLRLSVTSLGLHAQVLAHSGSYMIDPYYHMEDDFYGSYFRSDAIGGYDLPLDTVHDHDHNGGDSDHNGSTQGRTAGQPAGDGDSSGSGDESEVYRASGSQLRTYRTVIATTAEYSAQFGGSISGAMAGVTVTMNRVSGIFETELAIRFQLIPGMDQVIFTDIANDPFTNNDLDDMLDENQELLDEIFGEEATATNGYDLGHVFGYSVSPNGGLALLGGIGVDGDKAQGATVLDDVRSDVFHVDYVSHEIGHQFGAVHTFAFAGGPTDGIGVEPGSGSTIMGYAGLDPNNDTASNSVPYFHAVSLQQIIAHVDDVIPNVGTRMNTPNVIPTVDAGPNYTIPGGTPFVLTAQGNDPEGRDLLYTWDQMNPGIQPLSMGDLGVGPLFRFQAPTEQNWRTFPIMSDLVNNTNTLGELLPTTSRALDFRVTVRDVVSGVGAINDDDVRVNVVDTGAPFQITSLQSGEVLTGGNQVNFTWDVAGTDSGLINVQYVRITMSTDGGYTYPHVVLNSTENDGEELIYVPNQASDTVRFRIEAIGNIFFDITNTNVRVLAGTNPPGPGGGGGGTPIVDSCGIPLPEGTVSFAGAIGGNFFATNHAILDGAEQGGLGYDEVILNFLRGDGTDSEIPKSQYSVAVVGNGTSDWGFSNGTQFASGYERTTFYDINFITPQEFQELIGHNAIIILSADDAVAGGLTDEEMALWATVETEIAAAVNDRGLDLWVSASGGDSAYYDFLPTDAVTIEDVAGIDPLSGYLPNVTGQLLGLTYEMTNATDAAYHFLGFDDNLFPIEYRYATEFISLIGTNVAFYEDEIIPAADVPGGTTIGLTGFVYNDFDGDGFHDPLEPGVGGATFFIDYNGDGLLGLCEPTATSNAAGQFRLRSAYSGEFQIRQVSTAGAVQTTTLPQWVTIEADGTATLNNGALEFGVISGSDSGAPGTGGTVPVAPDAYLGASPIADDGVIFTHGLDKGPNTVTIVSSVDRTNVVLNAWMDFNKDGDWNDPGERIFTNLRLQPGQNTYTFTVPNTVFDDSMLPEGARLPIDVRFRVGPTLNVGPEANDSFGEIEDYQVYIKQAADNGLRAANDVFEYVEDTDGQTFNVLANDTSFFGRTLSIVPGSVNVIGPVTVPPLDIRVSADGRRIIFDADGVADLATDITFEYTVQDSAGVTATATVTLVAAVDDEDLAGGAPLVQTFNNGNRRADVNGDGRVTGIDLARVLSELRNEGVRTLPQLGKAPSGFNRFIDVNGDGRFNSRDLAALLDDMLLSSVQSGEPIEQEPLSTQTLTAESNSPAGDLIQTESVEIAAPISSGRSDEFVPGAMRVVVGVQPLSSDLTVASGSRLSPAGAMTASLIQVEEELADATLASLGSEQDDLLLWVDDDSLDYLDTEASEEDDLFANDQWDDEVLAL